MLPHIGDFLSNLQSNNYSVLTVRNYKGYLETFDRFLNESNIHFKRISKETIISYKEYLTSFSLKTSKTSNHSEKLLAPCTINYKLIGLRVYLRYLISIDYPCPLAPEAVENLKIIQKQPRLPDLKELISLIEAPCPDADIMELRDKAILETLFNTGLRVSELVNLNRNQISLEPKQISLRAKGNKIRTVFLSDTTAKWIESYLRSRQDNFIPLFIRHNGQIDIRNNGEGMRLTVRSIQRVVIRYAERCGLSIKATPQTLRHCFTLYLAGERANPVPLQVLFSHESLDGINHYAH